MNIINFLVAAVLAGTPLLFGTIGEILHERVGHLNLGVEGMMSIGACSGFMVGYMTDNFWIAMLAAFAGGAFGALIYAVLTVTFMANQNVTGLALTIFGMGVANFFGVFILNGASYTAAPLANSAFAQKIPVLSSKLGVVSQTVFSYGFLVYAAIIIAVIFRLILNKTRVGLNLRAVGENPATADAAGISVTRYKYLATCIGAGLSGIGGLYYVLDYNQGIWATTEQIEALGWLAVALVIFTTWKPLNAIWGAYLFGMLYWLYQFLPNLLGIKVASYMTDLIQMVPYVVTIIVLIVASFRKKKENQPPANLGLSYFREDR